MVNADVTKYLPKPDNRERRPLTARIVFNILGNLAKPLSKVTHSALTTYHSTHNIDMFGLTHSITRRRARAQQGIIRGVHNGPVALYKYGQLQAPATCP